MRESRKKHYLIYRITNLLNGMTYVGAHSTFIVDDDYMGSGSAIRQDIRLYGKQNFTKQVLHVFDDRTTIYDMERTLVDKEFCKRADTYNVKTGGVSGFRERSKPFIKPLVVQRDGIVTTIDKAMATENKRRMIAGEPRLFFRDLAAMIGIAPENLSRIKAGKFSMLRVTTLDKLCEALRCDVEDLFIHVPLTS